MDKWVKFFTGQTPYLQLHFGGGGGGGKPAPVAAPVAPTPVAVAPIKKAKTTASATNPFTARRNKASYKYFGNTDTTYQNSSSTLGTGI